MIVDILQSITIKSKFMLEILDKYPIAYLEFFDYANLNHGITVDKFELADEKSQSLTIISWLGYSQLIPETRNLTIKYLHKILDDFNKAARKYPDESRNLISEISKMDEKERQQKHPELFNARLEPTILPSLKDAFNFHLIPVSQVELAEHNEFWNNVIVDGKKPF
jgi:hypothetical protein